MDRLPPIGSGIPSWVAVSIGVLLAGVLLFLVSRWDSTRGTLTISVLVILGFLATLGWAVRFNIPQDPETAALVGGLVAAFGAVVAYWIGGGGRSA